MPTNEDTSIERALQTYGDLTKLKDLGLKPQDLNGLTTLDLGAGKNSSLQVDLQKLGIKAEVIMVDSNPETNSEIRKGKFSKIPVPDGSIDLLISRNACPMYLPADNLPLAVQVINEIKRVLKVGGEARLSPWSMRSPKPVARGVISDEIMEKDAPEIFQAMRNVPGLIFQLISEGDIDPRSGEERRFFQEMMIIRKT